MAQNLVRRFGEAGLELRLLGRPLVETNEEIFQMDIERERSRERYRLWPGHADNRVEVLSLDKGMRQLVLRVHEPQRAFQETVSKRWMTPFRLKESVRSGDFRLLRETKSAYIVERKTSPADRRYLCGMDERHLFIAQFRKGTSVRDAHESLKPDAIRGFDRSCPGRTVRQGEWFFTPLSAQEALIVKGHLRDAPYAVRRRESLGGNGRPHVVDETLRIANGLTFARGAVRHPDHKTRVLEEWHRVHRNAEVVETSFGADGVFWID